MKIEDIEKGLSGVVLQNYIKDVAEAVYWHSIRIRRLPPETKINWKRVLNDKDYRLRGVTK